MAVHDLNLERQILAVLLRDKNLLSSMVSSEAIRKEHFSDLSLRRIFVVLTNLYLKNFKRPTKRALKLRLNKRIKNADKERYDILVDKLFGLKIKAIKDNFPTMLDDLEELREGRIIQKAVVKLGRCFENNDIPRAIEEYQKASGSLALNADDIDEGDFVDDFEDRKALVLDKRDNPDKYPAVPCRIPIYRGDSPYNAKLDYLQEILNGGFYPGKLYLTVGHSNSGKSVFLMECAYQCAWAGKTAVIFTIEMMKLEEQYRIDSRMSRIKHTAFERGVLTNKEIKKWGKRKDKFQEHGGQIYVVGYPKGCTVKMIEAKLSELKRKLGGIDLVCIDYLNDMRPNGKFVNVRDWSAIGEVSWDMKQLTKYFDNNNGIPIITANQGKKGERNMKILGEGSVAFSPLPHQHADVVMMLKEELDDNGNIKYLSLRFDKHRSGKKFETVYMVPDFSIMNIATVVNWDDEDF